MRVLLIDIGNSRIKWATLTDGRLGARHTAAHGGWRSADFARRLFGAAVPPERALISSVAGAAVARRLATAARRAGIATQFIRVPRRGAGVTVGYLEPWRLGVDRYVGAVGAHQLFKGVAKCVVGIGTALTIDLIDTRGRHRGGAIIPAPALMVRTLFDRTDGIGRRARGGAPGHGRLFARSTRGGVMQGARYAAAAVIERAAEEARALSPRGLLVILTGGGAGAVRPLVRGPCLEIPDLVLRGLAVLAQTPRLRN